MMTDVIPNQAAIVLRRHYPVPPERVYRAWTEPEVLKEWFAPSADWKVPVVEIDPREGGRYRIVMIAPNGDEHEGRGEYREVSPPTKLVFTWTWDFTEGRESTVSVEFRATDGGTTLHLTHERLAPERREAHSEGWTKSLERLGQIEL
jgi:uncharacterized protein YndB with AHSA1/START domain